MKEVEISEIPPLAPGEHSLLESHSLLNMLNVMRGEIVLIGLALANDSGLLDRALSECGEVIASLRSPEAARRCAERIDDIGDTIFSNIGSAVTVFPENGQSVDVAESTANLRTVMTILRVRARELLARLHHPGGWMTFSAAELRRDLAESLTAMEQNSRGKYHFIYNAALQHAGEYYLDLRMEGVRGDQLQLPKIFPDVLRDLTANARKFTPPGGHIISAIHAGVSMLRLTVQDTGRGIPPDELASVVHFGHRAKNVSDVRAMGGGFGLTKAFFVAKQYGGRFWIASELGRGTRVRMEIPLPTAGPQP